MSNIQQSPYHTQLHQGCLRQEQHPDHPLRHARPSDWRGETKAPSGEHILLGVPPLNPALWHDRRHSRRVQLVDEVRAASHRSWHASVVSKATQFSGAEQGGHVEVETHTLGLGPAFDGEHAERHRWTHIAEQWRQSEASSSWREGRTYCRLARLFRGVYDIVVDRRRNYRSDGNTLSWF